MQGKPEPVWENALLSYCLICTCKIHWDVFHKQVTPHPVTIRARLFIHLCIKSLSWFWRKSILPNSDITFVDNVHERKRKWKDKILNQHCGETSSLRLKFSFVVGGTSVGVAWAVEFCKAKMKLKTCYSLLVKVRKSSLYRPTYIYKLNHIKHSNHKILYSNHLTKSLNVVL